jgi:hypothetical protein
MGFFKGLLGKDRGDSDQGKRTLPKLSPGYQRIHAWIETRIGPIDPSNPDLRTKLDDLLRREKGRYPSPQGRLTFTPVGNDTFVTGETRRFKNRLRRLGLTYDRKMRRWVAKDRHLTELDVDMPSELMGLRRYIESMPYRARFK